MARMRSFKTFCKASEYVGMDTVPHKKKALKEETEEVLDEGQKPYVSYTSPEAGRKGSHDVLNHKGEVDKSFPWNKEGREAASQHLKKHWDRLSGSTNEEVLDERNKENKFKKDLHVALQGKKTHLDQIGVDHKVYAKMSGARNPGGEHEAQKSMLKSFKQQGRQDMRAEETLEELAHGATPKTFVTGTAKNRTVQDGLHDRLSKHYNIDDEDKKHLAVFAQYGHDINKGLKDKNKPKEETSKPKKANPGAEEAAKKEGAQLDSHTKALDGALGQHVSPTADFHVYSALKQDPVKSHEEATGVKHDGKSEIRGTFNHFAQASINPAVAREHAEGTTHFGTDKTNHVLKLKVPAKSKHGVYVGDHGHPEHKEFLMRPGRKFHISGPAEDHGNTKIWHGELQG
jgi:hypothetical protein